MLINDHGSIQLTDNVIGETYSRAGIMLIMKDHCMITTQLCRAMYCITTIEAPNLDIIEEPLNEPLNDIEQKNVPE